MKTDIQTVFGGLGHFSGLLTFAPGHTRRQYYPAPDLCVIPPHASFNIRKLFLFCDCPHCAAHGLVMFTDR